MRVGKLLRFPLFDRIILADMKVTFSLIFMFLAVASSSAQWRSITWEEYGKAFGSAIFRIDSGYPYVLTLTADFIENGKVVRTDIEVREFETGERSRTKRTIVDGGTKTTMYQISLGSEKVYCSDDGVKWKPSSPNECTLGPLRVWGPRQRESAEYTVRRISLAGQEAKLYRDYSVFAPPTPNGKKFFEETTSTIDSRGLFLSVIIVEGTLDPRKVTFIRKQIWDYRAKIKPIVAPNMQPREK